VSQLSRRGFLAGVIAGGGALSLAVNLGGCGGSGREHMIRRADETGELAPNIYITILPDGRVALAINKSEIGQGVTTSFATLVAEELDVGTETIDFYFADSFPEYRTSFMMHQTGGSTSTKEAFTPMRRAAASAREMLIGAAAEQWQVPRTECTTAAGQVLHAASGRAAGYGDLTKLAAHQPVPGSPKLRPRAQWKVIGKPGTRVDARAKVEGTAQFGIDVVVPGMVRAIMIHGPQFGARAKSVRADAARAMRGVIDVFAIDGGVAVVAEKYWQALAASRAVEVEWEDGQTAGLDTEEMRRAMLAYRGHGASVKSRGKTSKALGRAARKVEAVYEVPYLAHATMEPQNCTVSTVGGKIEVWAPTQSPTVIQEFVAHALGSKRDRVLVHTTYCGGGFGRRAVGDCAAQCARIAKKVGKPVQLIWSRESDTTQGFYRPQTTAFMRGGLDKDGRVVALANHTVGQPIILDGATMAHAAMPGIPRALQDLMINSVMAMFASNTVPDVFSTEGIRDTPYGIGNLFVEFTPVDTGIPVCAWRSVGHSYNGFVMESFVDELAHAADQDPYQLRLGMLKEGSRPRRVLEAVAKLSGWGSAVPAGMGRGIARHTSFGTEVAEVADVEIVDGRIRVKKVYCAVDCGVAVNPDGVRAQMEGAIVFGLSAALGQEITMVDGVVQQTNFDSFPALRMHECPEIVVEILDSDEAPSGVGEPGLPPIAPAVANAIFAATGVRLRRMPLQKAWEATR
jgi:CO/xanthine dehydrogenase Mo-binding subunit